MSDFPPYRPDDSKISLETLAFLHSPAGTPLLQKAADLGPGTPNVAEVARLRRDYSPTQVHAALTIANLQPKAREKFPELAGHTIWATPEALEQATDSAVARHKASRFQAAGATQILDLCSGIGGDALALQTVAQTLAVDLSAVRLQCLRYNAESLPLQIETATENIEQTLAGEIGGHKTGNAFFHLDPARRTAGHRSAAYADLIPGPKILEKIIGRFPAGALKISSATDFTDLPPGHLELISHNRVVVQAVLWTGKIGEMLGVHNRTATTIHNHSVTTSFTAIPAQVDAIYPSFPPAGGYLYEADGSFTRAGLSAVFANDLKLPPLTNDAGYLFSAIPVSPPHPALTEFQIHAAVAFSEARVIEMLSRLPPAQAGPIEVKTRGKIPGVDTDHLQVAFSKASPFRRTVLIYRNASQTIAVAASRI